MSEQNDKLTAALRGFLDWAQRQCPCENELPNPCPLCDASVENLEACKAIEAKFPRQILADARAALALAKPISTPEMVRHIKRGSTYEVVGEAEVQISNDPWSASEGDKLTIYRCMTDGKLWARPTREFQDGRFESFTACDHDWVDASNKYVSGGELCLKCHAIRATPTNG